MALGRRCDNGCESWPDQDDFSACPVCGEQTTRYSNLDPIDADEAASVLAHAKFEAFYADRCRKRGITIDSPMLLSPEESLKWGAKYPGGRPDNA